MKVAERLIRKKSRILAHRGLWGGDVEPNTLQSISSALEQGFGVETDLRDCNRRLSISHDPPAEQLSLWFDDVAQILQASKFSWLALNVKSDGLVEITPQLPNPHFYFDMSIPERRKYVAKGKPVARRLSEDEPLENAEIGDSATPVWVDCFESDWYLEDSNLARILKMRGMKFFVSPELHGRPFETAWQALVKLFNQRSDLGICTDYPQEFYDASQS